MPAQSSRPTQPTSRASRSASHSTTTPSSGYTPPILPAYKGAPASDPVDDIKRKKNVKMLVNRLRTAAHDDYVSHSGLHKVGLAPLVYSVPNDPSHRFRPAYTTDLRHDTPVIISEYPLMHEVYAALVLIPTIDSDYPNPAPNLLLIHPLVASAPAVSEALESCIEASCNVICDEAMGTAGPVRAVQHSVHKRRSFYKNIDYYEADFTFAPPTGYTIDDDILFHCLREKLVFCAKGAFYYDGIIAHPRTKGSSRKSYKMSSVSRCADFASMLCADRVDFSLFTRRAKNVKATGADWKGKALINVPIPRSAVSDAMLPLYDAYRKLSDVVELWKAAAVEDKAFHIGYEDIDAGTAAAKMSTFADEIGISSFLDAYEAGVPVSDIVA